MRALAVIAYISAGVGALGASQRNHMDVCGHGAPDVDVLLIFAWPGLVVFDQLVGGAEAACRSEQETTT